VPILAVQVDQVVADIHGGGFWLSKALWPAVE
jgi:hypothetical protein